MVSDRKAYIFGLGRARVRPFWRRYLPYSRRNILTMKTAFDRPKRGFSENEPVENSVSM